MPLVEPEIEVLDNLQEGFAGQAVYQEAKFGMRRVVAYDLVGFWAKRFYSVLDEDLDQPQHQHNCH